MLWGYLIMIWCLESVETWKPAIYIFSALCLNRGVMRQVVELLFITWGPWLLFQQALFCLFVIYSDIIYTHWAIMMERREVSWEFCVYTLVTAPWEDRALLCDPDCSREIELSYMMWLWSEIPLSCCWEMRKCTEVLIYCQRWALRLHNFHLCLHSPEGV